MSRRVAGRRVLNGRLAGIVVVLVLATLLAWWLLALRPWPFSSERRSFERRLDTGVSALEDHRIRAEARMRLQLLETAMADGRRSNELRSSYRLLEELLEPVLSLQEQERRSTLAAELDRLLPDLSRDRSAARARIARLSEILRSPAGPGRQGGER